MPSRKEQQRLAELIANANTLLNPSFPQLPSEYIFPIVTQIIDNCLREMWRQRKFAFPNLGYCESISLFTDFGGEHKKSNYNTYAFLVCAFKPLDFERGMANIRRKYRLSDPPVEIAFKKRKYRPIYNSLPDYLRILDNTVPGLLCTMAVPKDIDSLILGSEAEGEEILEFLSSHGIKGWKKKTAQKMLRVNHIAAYLCALLNHRS